eukprot:s1023_g11.t1
MPKHFVGERSDGFRTGTASFPHILEILPGFLGNPSEVSPAEPCRSGDLKRENGAAYLNNLNRVVVFGDTELTTCSHKKLRHQRTWCHEQLQCPWVTVRRSDMTRFSALSHSLDTCTAMVSKSSAFDEDWRRDDLPFPSNKEEFKEFQQFDHALRGAQTADKDVLSLNINRAARIATSMKTETGIKHVVRRLCLVSKDASLFRETAVFTIDSILRHATHRKDKALRKLFEAHLQDQLCDIFQRALQDSNCESLAQKFYSSILVKWKDKGWCEPEINAVAEMIQKLVPTVRLPDELKGEDLVPEFSPDDDMVKGGDTTNVMKSVPHTPGYVFGAESRKTQPMTPQPYTPMMGQPVPMTPVTAYKTQSAVLRSYPATPGLTPAASTPIYGAPMTPVLQRVPQTPGPGSVLQSVPATPSAAPHLVMHSVPMTPGLESNTVLQSVPATPGVGFSSILESVPATPGVGVMESVPATPLPGAARMQDKTPPLPEGMPMTPVGGHSTPQPFTPAGTAPPTPGVGTTHQPYTPVGPPPGTPAGPPPATPGVVRSQPYTPAGPPPGTPAGPPPPTPGVNQPYTPAGPPPGTPAGPPPGTPAGLTPQSQTQPYTPGTPVSGTPAGPPPNSPGQPGTPAGPPPSSPGQSGTPAGPPPNSPGQPGTPAGPPPSSPGQPGTPAGPPPSSPGQPGTPAGPPPNSPSTNPFTPGLAGSSAPPGTPAGPPPSPGGAEPGTPASPTVQPWTPLGPPPQTPNPNDPLGRPAPKTPTPPPATAVAAPPPADATAASNLSQPAPPALSRPTRSRRPPQSAAISSEHGMPMSTRSALLTPMAEENPSTPAFMPIAGGDAAPSTPAPGTRAAATPATPDMAPMTPGFAPEHPCWRPWKQKPVIPVTNRRPRGGNWMRPEHCWSQDPKARCCEALNRAGTNVLSRPHKITSPIIH